MFRLWLHLAKCPPTVVGRLKELSHARSVMHNSTDPWGRAPCGEPLRFGSVCPCNGPRAPQVPATFFSRVENARRLPVPVVPPRPSAIAPGALVLGRGTLRRAALPRSVAERPEGEGGRPKGAGRAVKQPSPGVGGRVGACAAPRRVARRGVPSGDAPQRATWRAGAPGAGRRVAAVQWRDRAARVGAGEHLARGVPALASFPDRD